MNTPSVRPGLRVVLAAWVLLTACSRKPGQYTPQYAAAQPEPGAIPRYSFGVPPIRHVRSLWDRYSRLIQVLNISGTRFTLKLESAQTPDAYDLKLRQGVLAFAIVDPYQVLVAEHLGYTVIARTGRADRIQGVMIVARASGIHRVRDLQGRTIAFTNPTALAATLLNQYDLFESGLRIAVRSTIRYTHSPETSLLNVALGQADAAGVSASDWEDFQRDNTDAAAKLAVLRRTDTLSGPAVMASHAVSSSDVRGLQESLVRLSASADGRTALERAGVSAFLPGDSVSYDDVWDFLQRYQQVLGPLPDRPGAQ